MIRAPGVYLFRARIFLVRTELVHAILIFIEDKDLFSPEHIQGQLFLIARFYLEKRDFTARWQAIGTGQSCSK